MKKNRFTVHPYIPNSVPAIKESMLRDVGVRNAEDFYADIPPDLRLARRMNLPDPFLSECALKRHIEGILAKNTPAGELLSFVGAGCYHFSQVPPPRLCLVPR